MIFLILPTTRRKDFILFLETPEKTHEFGTTKTRNGAPAAFRSTVARDGRHSSLRAGRGEERWAA